MLAGKGGHFAAIATHCHRAPPASVGSRRIIEKKTAAGIGAHAQTCLGTFGDNIRSRTRDGGKQPFEAPFPGHEFDLPTGAPLHQIIVALCDSKNFIDRFNPFGSDFLLPDHGRKEESARGAETTRLPNQGFHLAVVSFGQTKKLGTAIRRDDFCGLKKRDEPVPGKLRGNLA